MGISAKLSNDDGATWGEEIILRADGGNHDIGYPRTVQRPDGAIVTVYYYNDEAEDRYLAATLASVKEEADLHWWCNPRYLNHAPPQSPMLTAAWHIRR
ncbi:MAG: sialidase family protein [Caldilineaceae bacterium]